MSKECVFASVAPAALGPYSHANKAGNFIFASGQLGLDPATGALVEDDVKAQAKQALQNLAIVLKASGCSLSDVIKTTVFLKDIRDFAAVNEVYGSFFQKDFPARSAIQVAALPKDGLVEIEAIAYKE